jgi:hypothetical protein
MTVAIPVADFMHGAVGVALRRCAPTLDREQLDPEPVEQDVQLSLRTAHASPRAL